MCSTHICFVYISGSYSEHQAQLYSTAIAICRMYFNLLQMWNWLSKSMTVQSWGSRCQTNMNVENRFSTLHSRLLLIHKRRFNKPFHITDSNTFAKMRLILNGATLRITKSEFGLSFSLSFGCFLLGNRFSPIRLTGWLAMFRLCALTTNDETKSKRETAKKEMAKEKISHQNQTKQPSHNHKNQKRDETWVNK